jgi:hypothetical protein
VRGPRLLDRRIENVGPGPEIVDRGIGRGDVVAQLRQCVNVGVQRRDAGGDRGLELLDAFARLVDLDGERLTRVSISAAAETGDFRRQRAARSTSAAGGPGPAARRRSSSTASRASNSRRCAAVSRSSDARCA